MTNIFLAQQKRPIPYDRWKTVLEFIDSLEKDKKKKMQAVDISKAIFIGEVYNEFFAIKKAELNSNHGLKEAYDFINEKHTKQVQVIFDNELIFKTYAVYENPADYPGKYVVRCFFTPKGAEPIAFHTPYLVTNDISEVTEAMLKLGLVATAPLPGDDPVIKMVFI